MPKQGKRDSYWKYDCLVFHSCFAHSELKDKRGFRLIVRGLLKALGISREKWLVHYAHLKIGEQNE